MKKFLFLAFVGASALSDANTYYYAEWFAKQTGIPGSMTGQINVGGNHTIGISYGGNVIAESQVNDTGTYYYTAYNGGHNYYVNSEVSNAPTRKDIVALAGQTTNLITNTIYFSEPVMNPIMSIVSLGSPAQISNYDFNVPFTILSQGPGYWGSGSLWTPGGNRLTGMEGSGVIQLKGTFSSFSFTASPNEYWSGFTIGVVPEPASLLALSLGALILVRRRNRA